MVVAVPWGFSLFLSFMLRSAEIRRRFLYHHVDPRVFEIEAE
jgi:hypothetical protein